jgi:hypothetical protein
VAAGREKEIVMTLKERIHVLRAVTDADRIHALKVLKATYRDEKNWVKDETIVFAPDDLQNSQVSWFVVFANDQPVGVLRVLYNPPLQTYREYGLQHVVPGIDIERFIQSNRIAEIGRFAILPEYRRYSAVVVSLMGAASGETVSNGFTHYITDIFEGERHSPYHFHTHVMGFQAVATHDVGELNCPNRRITMILDLKQAYHRLRSFHPRVFRLLTDHWDESWHKLMCDGVPPTARPSGQPSTGAG